MKLAKIYTLILLVTGISILGTVCNSGKNNVHIEVDTTQNKVLSIENYKKVEHFFSPINGNFIWVINISSKDIELMPKDNNGNNLALNKIKLQSRACYFFDTSILTSIKTVVINEENETQTITIGTTLGRLREELGNTSYAMNITPVNNGEHIIGVEIMNK